LSVRGFVAVQSFTGNGDNVENVNLSGQPAVLSFSCPNCEDNTVVKTNGFDSLLVNTIGSYSGTHLLDGRSGSVTSQISVQAGGDWTLTVSDLSTVQPTTGAASGTGDAVVNMISTATTATITNTVSADQDGPGNFVIQDYTSSVDLVVNEIGGYSGTDTMSLPGIVQVTSNGSWTITPGT
jgi:hypothetical protein